MCTRSGIRSLVWCPRTLKQPWKQLARLPPADRPSRIGRPPKRVLPFSSPKRDLRLFPSAPMCGLLPAGPLTGWWEEQQERAAEARRTWCDRLVNSQTASAGRQGAVSSARNLSPCQSDLYESRPAGRGWRNWVGSYIRELSSPVFALNGSGTLSGCTAGLSGCTPLTGSLSSR